MPAMIERFPRQGVELYTPGDVGMPYRSRPRMSAAEGIVLFCIGVTCVLFIATFVLKAAATIGAHFAVVSA